MSDPAEIERIMIVIDGDNLSDHLCESSLTLHQMIDACVRDFGSANCKVVEGPALFATLHDGSYDLRYRNGRLKHQLLSEIAVPRKYKYRPGLNEFGEPGEKGYDDSRIMNYVMNRLDKFDTIFIFSCDYHFAEFAWRLNREHGKAFLMCGFSGKSTKDWLVEKSYFLDLSTLELPKEKDSGMGAIDWEEFHQRALRITGRDKEGWV